MKNMKKYIVPVTDCKLLCGSYLMKVGEPSAGDSLNPPGAPARSTSGVTRHTLIVK